MLIIETAKAYKVGKTMLRRPIKRVAGILIQMEIMLILGMLLAALQLPVFCMVYKTYLIWVRRLGRQLDKMHNNGSQQNMSISPGIHRCIHYTVAPNQPD